ncbi:hypothetical protein GCM10027073_60530 [Streptomyces chlorus]
MTRHNTPGDSPGAPRTPNASANGSSAKTSASRSRTRIARLPLGNAARATAAVCSGTSGSPFGRIDIAPPPRPHDRKRPHRRSSRAHHHPRTELRSRVNIQFLSAPDGTPLWISDVEPGSTLDITAARLHVLTALYKAAAGGLPTLADKGYIGAGIGIRVPVRRPKGRSEKALDIDTRITNALIRHVRALGERTAAELKERWRTLKRISLSPTRIGDIARAALVLNNHWR